LIIYSLVRYLIAKKKKIIIIVPSISLVEQLFSDFKNDYGWSKAFENVCLNYGGQELDTSKNVLLTTWQSVYKRSEEFFGQYSALIVDEAHSMQGKSISEIGRKCVGASFRIGLTGTLPENEADFHTVTGFLGPVIHKVMSKELMDKGILSQIKIKNLILKYPEEMRHARSSYQKEVDDISKYENRNIAIDYVINAAKPKENILILVTKIELLRSVKVYIEKKFKGRKVYEIYGKTDADVRETIRKSLEKDDGAILVASYGTFSTGANVKKLHHIVLFSSYKSQIKVLQSIGRGLRTHESKDFVTIFDVVDNLQYTDGKKKYKNHVYRHWTDNRLKYYEEQQFDYENYYLDI
jgi:superfamily II DNA or RNA helicase